MLSNRGSEDSKESIEALVLDFSIGGAVGNGEASWWFVTG